MRSSSVVSGISRTGLLLAAALALQAAPAAAQQAPPKGTLERITVHGRALEDNLEGDSPDRPVVVYLPPSYARDTTRRYPVLYFLHGYTATAEAYVKSLAIPDSIDRAVAAGAREMIVVIPDAFTRYSGSMFSNSPPPATGKPSSPASSRSSSTSGIARSRRATAAVLPDIRWGATARCASA